MDIKRQIEQNGSQSSALLSDYIKSSVLKLYIPSSDFSVLLGYGLNSSDTNFEYNCQNIIDVSEFLKMLDNFQNIKQVEINDADIIINPNKKVNSTIKLISVHDFYGNANEIKKDFQYNRIGTIYGNNTGPGILDTNVSITFMLNSDGSINKEKTLQKNIRVSIKAYRAVEF